MRFFLGPYCPSCGHEQHDPGRCSVYYVQTYHVHGTQVGSEVRVDCACSATPREKQPDEDDQIGVK